LSIAREAQREEIAKMAAVQLITFYLNQFTAIVPTLFQFAFLLVILAYKQWYLVPDSKHKP